MKAAMLILDMQKGCFDVTPEKVQFDEAAEYINEVSEYFRTNNLPVFVIQDVNVGQGPGSKGFENYEGIRVKSTDISIHKAHNNSFWETELDTQLKERDIEFLIISGFSAEYCVTFTYGGAIERGYKVSLLQNGVAGMDIEQVRATTRIRPAISYQALDYFMNNVFTRNK